MLCINHKKKIWIKKEINDQVERRDISDTTVWEKSTASSLNRKCIFFIKEKEGERKGKGRKIASENKQNRPK